ncbi:MAG TPA: hypothetical protein DIC52_18310 [Candidatus Latescibacteria bacterium]|nr:hypothetical protein [Candidatus Latescibacterota bacterium]
MTENVESMETEDLVQAILDLEHDREVQVEDTDLAQELSDHVKEYVDELVQLRADESVGEGRKRKGRKNVEVPEGPVPELMALPPGEQARWIFMERYISLEKHEDILGINLQPEAFAEFQESFDRLIKDLLLLPRSLEAAGKNDITGLQKLFASYVPIFRYNEIADDHGVLAESSVANLRQAYHSYFYKRRKKTNWFEAQQFYTEPVPGPRWVLCETEYHNCTLRRPHHKLDKFARDWDLPPEFAHQKSIVEDIYDRIIVGEALAEDLFAGGTNNMTTTQYRVRKSRRLVFTVQRVHKITLHGKRGIPHWRASRRLWPALHPTLAFPETP